MADYHSTQSTSTKASDSSGASNKVSSPEKKKQKPAPNEFFSPNSEDNSVNSEEQQSDTNLQLSIPMNSKNNSILDNISTTLEARYAKDASGSGQEQ